MKSITLILLTTLATLAQIPTPDIRIIANSGDYGPTPGIWGSPARTNGSEVLFPVDDNFFVRTEPRSAVSTNIVSDVSYQNVAGRDMQRIMSVGVNIVNIGTASLHYGSVFAMPQNYYWWGNGWPGVRDMWTLTLRDTNNVQVVHEFKMHSTLTWFNRPAIPGAPYVTEFGPWWQGIPPGYASQMLEPDMWYQVVDTSAVEDGEYFMTISVRGGNSTTRRVRIEAMEVRVTGF